MLGLGNLGVALVRWEGWWGKGKPPNKPNLTTAPGHDRTSSFTNSAGYGRLFLPLQKIPSTFPGWGCECDGGGDLPISKPSLSFLPVLIFATLSIYQYHMSSTQEVS